MKRRSDVVQLAILGLLLGEPMHGYEIRKQLRHRLGLMWTLSYGTLYPVLRSLVGSNWIEPVGRSAPGEIPATLTTSRARIVYSVTPEGKEHFLTLMRQSESLEWDDDTFDVHFAFFSQTDPVTRLNILESRRARMRDRLAQARTTSQDTRDRADAYTSALHRRGLEATEREVRWLDELIDSERSSNMTHLSTHQAQHESPY